MKKMLTVVFVVGFSMGVAAQTVKTIVTKSVKLDLAAGSRLVCSVNPKTISPLASLVLDYKVPTGKKLNGRLHLSAAIQ